MMWRNSSAYDEQPGVDGRMLARWKETADVGGGRLNEGKFGTKGDSVLALGCVASVAPILDTSNSTISINVADSILIAPP